MKDGGMIRIHLSKSPTSKSVVRKYANVQSTSAPKTEYLVVKIRILRTGHYKYKCSCPDHMFRNRDCKHIIRFQNQEDKIRRYAR